MELCPRILRWVVGAVLTLVVGTAGAGDVVNMSLILAVSLVTAVQHGGGYDIAWYAIESGGGTSSGDAFVLEGTIAQPTAGVAVAEEFTMEGGFWIPQSPAARCAADLDGDDLVNGADLGLLLAAWATSEPAADLDGTGVVDGADLGLLLSAWGPCPSATN